MKRPTTIARPASTTTIGSPSAADLKDAAWDYFSFDLPKAQPTKAKGIRDLKETCPAGMENWFAPDFDAKKAGWKSGAAPFGVEKDPIKYPEWYGPGKRISAQNGVREGRVAAAPELRSSAVEGRPPLPHPGRRQRPRQYRARVTRSTSTASCWPSRKAASSPGGERAASPAAAMSGPISATSSRAAR